MSMRNINRSRKSGRTRVWTLLLPALAYVALTFQASVALASMTDPTGVMGVTGPRDHATIFYARTPGPLAPCCGELECVTASTLGPPVTTVNEQGTKPRHQKTSAIVLPRELIPAAASRAPLPITQFRGFPRHLPLYLSTARLRL